jgi:hypothetical protein
MEAEIIALGSCCHELLSIIALVDKIGVAVRYKKPNDDNPSSSTMHVTSHEDKFGLSDSCYYATSSVYSLQQTLCHQNHLVLREDH